MTYQIVIVSKIYTTVTEKLVIMEVSYHCMKKTSTVKTTCTVVGQYLSEFFGFGLFDI